MPIPLAIQAMGMQAAGNVVNEGMGIAFQGIKNKQQRHQARHLQDLQLEAEATRNERNEAMALRMWEKTGYGGQVEQLKNAGLNPGLLYGMGGGGGGTTATPAGTGSTAHAETAKSSGMGIESGMRLALLEAERKNIEADTKLKEVDATKRSGVDTEKATTEIAAIKQGITNAQITESILKWEDNIKRIDSNIAEQTQGDRMGQIVSMAEAAASTAEMIERDNSIEGATKEAKIQQIRAESIGAILRNGLTTAQINKTNAEIKQIAESIAQKWTELSQKGKELMLKGLMDKLQMTKPTGTMGAGPASVPWYYHDKEDFIKTVDKIMGEK